MTLTSFPRGGKKPQTPQSSFQKNVKNSGKKKQRRKLNDKGFANDTDLVAQTAERLTIATLCEGLVVLCRISELTEYELIISLPGGITGRAQAIDLSESYTTLLQSIIETENSQSNEFRTLPELYKPGDYVVCYVKNLETDQRWQVNLSLEPQLINQNISSNSLRKGLTLVCTVNSIEDHGYVVDCGIPNVKGFVPNKETADGKQYFPGNQLLCTIKEVKSSDNVSMIKLSTKLKSMDKDVIDKNFTLNTLVPGSGVHLSVSKVLSNGLQVSFGDKNVGYINRIYLDHPLSFYSEGMEVSGTLLYVIPLVRFAYFSLVVRKVEKNVLNQGDIKAATVLYREGNSIFLKLGIGFRGVVSLRKTGVDFSEISSKFQPNSKHKCRIMSYSWMDRIYVCTMERKDLDEKYFKSSSFTIGETVKVKIHRIHSKTGTLLVKAGRVIGTVIAEHLSDVGLSALSKFKVGEQVEARVLRIDQERDKVFFTLKRSLVKSDLPILHSIQEAKCGSKHHGVVVKINPHGLLIRFFGDAKGWVSSKLLNNKTADINWNYSIGQVVPVKIKAVNKAENKMVLSLIDDTDNNVHENTLPMKNHFQVGETVEGTVVDSSVDGVYVRIGVDDGNNVVTAYLPAGHMAPCKELASLLASKCMPGECISGLVFSTQPSLILTRTFAPQEQYRNFDSLNVGDCIPCSIRDITKEGAKVILPLNNFTTFGFVPFQRITSFELIHSYQILFTKIIAISKKEKQFNLTMELDKIWMKNESSIMNAVDVLNLYFNKLSELSTNSYYENKPISSVNLGQKVKGVVEKITEHGLVLKLNNNLQGIVRKDHYSDEYKKGDEVSGVIVWINFIHELVDVILLPSIVASINAKQNKLPNLPLETQLRGEIIMITKWFVLVVLKGKGKGCIAALPARRHINDLDPNLKPYAIGAKIRCYIVLNKDETDLIPICMIKSAFEAPKLKKEKEQLKRKNDIISDKSEPTVKRPKKENGIKSPTRDSPNKKLKPTQKLNDVCKAENGTKRTKVKEKSSPSKKKKKEESKGMKAEKEILDADADADPSDTSESEEENATPRGKKNNNEQVSTVPECGFFWDNKAVPGEDLGNRESSSEDEIEEQPKQKKKKKLSAAERRDLERRKEREIREREEALASNQIPNSIDQFDRLVLSSPDSSLVWLQYMAYHLQATEIEKARAVARRAIKTINFREENEKLNVWCGWLNLESKFGSPESLEEVLQEAIRTNDSLKIYTHMLTVHAEAGRQTEIEKIITTLTGKFKQNPQVWIDCGTALLQMGLKEKSRHIMQRALQSLPPSQHVNLIVRFAQLENKFGDKERAQTLFEQVLTSYPKRVDVWSSYVDSLIKSGDIDIARKVLERAVVQTLPAKKMKTLFKKFLSFEEQHGTPEGVAHVQRMAADYVEKQSNGGIMES